MSNRVSGRFAQEATMYISVNDALVEKLIALEGQAAGDPVPAQTTESKSESESATAETAATDETPAAGPEAKANGGPAE